MTKEVIITGFINPTKEGIALQTNIPAKLKTGNVKGNLTWVSWDKIGAALFENYTERKGVAELDELRNQ